MTTRTKFPKFDRPTYVPAEEPTLSGWPKPTAITLFSGLGSSSKALRDLGYSVLAHDFLPEAVASLNANGFDAVQGDIREVDFNSGLYSEVEVVVGGPPCQPFSQGGRNAGEDDPRDMIPDFIRAVAHTLPYFFILENVRGLAGPRHRAYLEARISDLEALGYVVDHRVLDAADHGVGQARKRLFILGQRVDRAESLAASGYTPISRPAEAIWWPSKQRQRTMAQVLGWTRTEAFRRNRLAPEAAWIGSIDDARLQWVFKRPATTVVGSFRPEVQAAPGYRSTGDGPRQNAPGSVVTTPAERLILQGLPADWIVKGAKSKVDLQIGNSCPTPLLAALLSCNV